MTKKHITILLVLVLGSLLLVPKSFAHTSVFSVGVRGGAQTYLLAASDPASDIKGAFGGTGKLDVRYTFYGCFTDRLGMGFTVGGGVGYGTSSFKGISVDHFSTTDYLGNQIDYTTSGAYRQTDKFATAEASLMLAFCFGNIIVNVGPRFMMPFATKTQLTVTNASIDAYYPRYDVHIINRPITGYLESPYTTNHKSQIINQKYNILMSAEVGYEWYFTSKSCLGFQLYADVAVWSGASPNPLTPNPLTPNPLIQVAPITDATNPIPAVTVNSPEYLVANRRYLDFGLRIYYAFSVTSSSSSSHPKPHRHGDTSLHHNRHLAW